MNERLNSLNPRQDLSRKQNYKTFHVIERDGTVVTSYRLHLPDSKLREEIICKHFLSKYVPSFIKEPVDINLISRDKPWDFVIALSNNETLSIEITAIADQEDMFTKMKYEERLSALTGKAEIQLHELQRIDHLFPDPSSAELIDQYQQQGLNKKSTVKNPYYQTETLIFDGGANHQIHSFKDLLTTAIDKKLSKNHPGKDSLSLLIDNRTTIYEAHDIISALEKSQDYLEELPFKEVWIYTGYYSAPDGSDTEYSLIAAKLSDKKRKQLNQQQS